MNINTVSKYGAYGFGIIGVTFIGYDILERRKLRKTITSFKTDFHVDVDDDRIASFINKVVEEEVHNAYRLAADKAVYVYKKNITDAVSNAVNECKNDISKDVSEEISKQVGKLNIANIKRDAVKDAKEMAVKELQKSMEDILKNYKEQLNNFAVMYSAVAEKNRKSNDALPNLVFDFQL